MESAIMDPLVQYSIRIIRENQSSSGAYYACPNFAHYRYSWFRDGSFCAYAMDLVGEHESAGRFHRWAANIIKGREGIVRDAITRAARNEPLGDQFLHARYDADGRESNEDWPNFQLDGIGTWLWSLTEHHRLQRQPLSRVCHSAARLAADYLKALWRLPCYDCWEEFPNLVHTQTVAAVYGGLTSYNRSTCKEDSAIAEIRTFLFSEGVRNGRFIKSIGYRDADASLVAIATPYRVVAPSDPLMIATIGGIENDLVRDGGVHRYRNDTYYGGGAWILLTAWLGWYYAEAGQHERALEAWKWVRTQADGLGNLPEQVPSSLNDPAAYSLWEERWGRIASPLLWSHAMYIVLSVALGKHSFPEGYDAPRPDKPSSFRPFHFISRSFSSGQKGLI